MSTVAVSGATVVSMAALVDSQIAALITSQAGVPISSVLINLGANDVGSMPAEATYKTNLAYIMDAFHAAFPSAQVYVARTWRRGYAAESNTLAGWIATVVGARAGWGNLGFDERVWLEGGNDGATMTTDGIHYSTAGKAECAAKWKAVLGY